KLRSERRKFRILACQNTVSRLQINCTFQVLTGAIAIARETTAQRHRVKHMIRIRLERERSSKVVSGQLDIARVEPFHAIVEMVFGGGQVNVGSAEPSI